MIFFLLLFYFIFSSFFLPFFHLFIAAEHIATYVIFCLFTHWYMQQLCMSFHFIILSCTAKYVHFIYLLIGISVDSFY